MRARTLQIFVLDTSATLAATLHCDVHVNKMIFEATQISMPRSTCAASRPSATAAITHKHHHLAGPPAARAAGYRPRHLAVRRIRAAFPRIGEHKIHACSAHLARIRMTVDGLTHADLPEQISLGDWLTWVTDVIQVGKAACMKIVKAVATCSLPTAVSSAC